MPRGYKIPEEDKDALLDLVREEIEAHKEGRLERLSSNGELGEIVGVSRSTIGRFIDELSEEERSYRERAIRIHVGGYANKLIQDDDRQALVELVQEEINAHKEGRLKRFSSFEELGTVVGNFAKNTIINCLSGLEGKQRDYRALSVKRRNGKIRMDGLDQEQKIELSRKGGNAITLEQRKENGKKASEALRKTRYAFNGHHYDSQSEATVATLLEKYVPDFRIREGKTYQINGEIPKSIDFLVNGEFVEWHPVLMFAGRGGLGDMPSVKQYQKYKSIKSEMLPERANVFERRYKRLLAANYLAQRQTAVDESQTYAGTPVTLLQSPEELYSFLSARGYDLPKQIEFVREFNQIKKQVKEENKIKSEAV